MIEKEHSNHEFFEAMQICPAFERCQICRAMRLAFGKRRKWGNTDPHRTADRADIPSDCGRSDEFVRAAWHSSRFDYLSIVGRVVPRCVFGNQAEISGRRLLRRCFVTFGFGSTC